MSLVSGRWFEELEAPGAVLINESLARQMYPGVDPLQYNRINGKPLKVIDLSRPSLVKKVLIADNLAPYANVLFAGPQDVSLLVAWGGVLAYAFQLYFDFSGYSDMAIGLSRLFGVQLPLNFASPYKATSIMEFWRRWHMTLSRFLRDYLYIPLGGNRGGEAKRYRNLLLTMLLGGLWHGAGWNFVIWGLWHGVGLIACHAWQKLGRPMPALPWPTIYGNGR